MKTHLDLFSGIGGFALAAGWAGFNTIGFCEVEDYPRRILSKRFPSVRLHGDIRELDGSAYRGVTLITGGYPCQPFSQAGKRQGAADDRHLWPEMLRVVKQARPSWVLEKTWLVTSRWGSTRCWLTWKAKATPAGRLLFQLVPSMPRIEETEFGSSQSHWPTPVADGDRAANYKQGGTSLGYAARMWPTSQASATKKSDRPTGKLNPTWVEWLMGYPIGWTDLED